MQTSIEDSPSILFVDQSGELGGAELSLLDIVKARPHSSKVILLSDGPFRERLRDAGVSVDTFQLGAAARIGRSGTRASLAAAFPALAATALKIAREARACDLIYANTQKAFVVSALAAKIARRPLIWHLRDMLTAEHFSSGLRKLAVTLANRSANCIIANSHATADAFQCSGGTCKIHVVHNGIDATPFDAIDRAAAQRSLRNELGVGNEILVGVFSRLAYWKGQHVLVEALDCLPDTHVVFAGGPLFGEGQYEAYLRQLVKAKGMESRCHFLGFRRDIPSLMAGVDIVTHTSIAPEPFGRVVVEGMLSGNPVIATEGGGVDEIIVANETGLLVRPDDPVSLRAAVQQLILSPQFARLTAERGRTSAHLKFSLSACLSGVDAVIAQVLNQRSLRRRHAGLRL